MTNWPLTPGDANSSDTAVHDYNMVTLVTRQLQDGNMLFRAAIFIKLSGAHYCVTIVNYSIVCVSNNYPLHHFLEKLRHILIIKHLSS